MEMTKQQILDHIRNTPVLSFNDEWKDIAEMYAEALAGISGKLTAMEMAEFIAVGMVARRKCLAADTLQPASVLNFMQYGVQPSLF
jgi:hypothetical protein